MLTNIFEYVLCLCFQDALIPMYDLQTGNWVSGYQAASDPNLMHICSMLFLSTHIFQWLLYPPVIDDLQCQMMTMKIKKDVQLKGTFCF
ncbi:unnamed protein product [Brassica oleracea]